MQTPDKHSDAQSWCESINRSCTYETCHIYDILQWGQEVYSKIYMQSLAVIYHPHNILVYIHLDTVIDAKFHTLQGCRSIICTLITFG